MKRLLGIDDENAPVRDELATAFVKAIHIFMHFSVLLSTVKPACVSTTLCFLYIVGFIIFISLKKYSTDEKVYHHLT